MLHIKNNIVIFWSHFKILATENEAKTICEDDVSFLFFARFLQLY